MDNQTVKDQVGRTVVVPKYPKSIVSLVPSQTELLFDLGLAARVVGITKFCIHPDDWFHSKTRIGGTKQLDFEAILALNPDLIIANKEENNKEDIERLEKDYSVWVSDVNDLDSALEMIRLIAELTKTDSSKLTQEIQSGFSQLMPIQPQKNTLYLIWKNPYMAAGNDTFINDLMQRCGFENVFSQSRYPELTDDEIVQLNPELILLSSEPFPFAEKHIGELQNLIPNATIKLVDGEMFSWYGSRLKLAPSYFQNFILGK